MEETPRFMMVLSTGSGAYFKTLKDFLFQGKASFSEKADQELKKMLEDHKGKSLQRAFQIDTKTIKECQSMVKE
jgi:hypothetical protein